MTKKNDIHIIQLKKIDNLKKDNLVFESFNVCFYSGYIGIQYIGFIINVKYKIFCV